MHDAIRFSSVLVELEGANGCQRCSSGGGCGAGLHLAGHANLTVSCFTSEAVKSDQQVAIEFDDRGSSWLWLVAGSYGLPLVGLLLSSLSVWLWIRNTATSTDLANVSPATTDLPVAIAACLGLAGGLFAWRLISPAVIQKLQKGLCLESARIVNNSSSSG